MAIEKKEIKSRDEIQILVQEFYSKVRKDTLIGPIFDQRPRSIGRSISPSSLISGPIFYWAKTVITEDPFPRISDLT